VRIDALPESAAIGPRRVASEFGAELDALDAARLAAEGMAATEADVDRALAAGYRDPADVAALLSPAAGLRLEELACASRDLTCLRFGRTVRLFAPLYVSNECLSGCVYCGFARGLPVSRRTLSLEEAEAEARFLTGEGFRHILLVSGEHRVKVSPDYLAELARRISGFVPSIAVETQTWEEPVYRDLVASGVEGVVIYQETYDRLTYPLVHIVGWKRNYERRIAAVEAAGRAGARRLGIGVLLGLAPDWRADVLAMVAHARFLTREYWRAEVTVSFPRLRPCASGFLPASPVADRELAQIICAVRLALPDVGIVLSTREDAALRDGLLNLGVTHMSAGSRTDPGGYLHPDQAEGQFDISDERPPGEVAAALRAAGLDPVWKDWVRL